MTKARFQISMSGKAGRLANILTETALKTPGLSLNESDPDTVLLALPTLLDVQIAHAQEMVDAGLISDKPFDTKPQ